MKKKRPFVPLPLMPAMCKTCPFRKDSPKECRDLQPDLIASALTEASRICHSTGQSLFVRTQGKARLCRGARNVQLHFFYQMGFLKAPTDKAWAARLREMQDKQSKGVL